MVKTSKQYKSLRFKMETYLGSNDKLCFSKYKTMEKILSQIKQITNELELDDLMKTFIKLMEKRTKLVNNE